MYCHFLCRQSSLVESLLPASASAARQAWAVPANAGKYASTVTPAPLGTITAVSPSPVTMKVMWAGTDDGNIQITSSAGATWASCTHHFVVTSTTSKGIHHAGVKTLDD